jgi:nitric oxide reductase activation protein
VEPNLANHDGAAIRTITKELLNESNKTKVIFMFADGMPSDVGYNNGLFDSAMAIKESVDKGIKFFYLLTRNRKTMSLEESHNFSILTGFVTDKTVVYDPAQLPYRTRDLFSMHLL